MSTRRRDIGFSPAMESELRKIEARQSKDAQVDYEIEHSAYGDWKRSLHANLYADSGDPDRPARSVTALPPKAPASPATAPSRARLVES